MSAFDKFCQIVDEIKKLSDRLIQEHKDSIIDTNGSKSQIVSKKETVIALRDELYEKANKAYTGDKILDNIIKHCIIFERLENNTIVDIKINNNGWYRFATNLDNDCLDKYLLYMTDALLDIKNGTNKYYTGNVMDCFDTNQKIVYSGRVNAFMMYVRSYYYNDGSKNYSDMQTKVDKLSDQVSESNNLSKQVLDKESIVNDRIDYLRKDIMCMYHSIADMKKTIGDLEDKLSHECQDNENLREQLQTYKKDHSVAFDNLRKELLINNGNLVYISNIKFSPEYDYESIKMHNRKLHTEFKRIYRIFMRGVSE